MPRHFHDLHLIRLVAGHEGRAAVVADRAGVVQGVRVAYATKAEFDREVISVIAFVEVDHAPEARAAEAALRAIDDVAGIISLHVEHKHVGGQNHGGPPGHARGHRS